MSGRIVLFGATGYTGRLTAQELVRQGRRPVLAGRDATRLGALALELGGEAGALPTAVADVAYPGTVAALVERGDVLITTVGPFERWGNAAVEAVLTAGEGTVYLDSTGEATFLRRAFGAYGTRARAVGATLVPAMGYDFVPGQLAAALALEEAGSRAVRVDVGYFLTGGLGGASGGTAASLAGQLMQRHPVRRTGRLRSERPAAHRRAFGVDGTTRVGVSIGSSESFTLARTWPTLQDVYVYLGWFGAHPEPLMAASAVGDLASRVPGARSLAQGVAGRFVRGSTGGPDEAVRDATGSVAVAEVFDHRGALLSRATVRGPNGYTLTGRLLAWGAVTALEGPKPPTGCLGPVEAFGLETFVAGCRDLGLSRSAPPTVRTRS